LAAEPWQFEVVPEVTSVGVGAFASGIGKEIDVEVISADDVAVASAKKTPVSVSPLGSATPRAPVAPVAPDDPVAPVDPIGPAGPRVPRNAFRTLGLI